MQGNASEFVTRFHIIVLHYPKVYYRTKLFRFALYWRAVHYTANARHIAALNNWSEECLNIEKVSLQIWGYVFWQFLLLYKKMVLGVGGDQWRLIQ